jgi:hypothetical protein
MYENKFPSAPDEVPTVFDVNDDRHVHYNYHDGPKKFYLFFNRESGILRISSSLHALEQLAEIESGVKKDGIVRLLLPPNNKELSLVDVREMRYRSTAETNLKGGDYRSSGVNPG